MSNEQQPEWLALPHYLISAIEVAAERNNISCGDFVFGAVVAALAVLIPDEVQLRKAFRQ